MAAGLYRLLPLVILFKDPSEGNTDMKQFLLNCENAFLKQRESTGEFSSLGYLEISKVHQLCLNALEKLEDSFQILEEPELTKLSPLYFAYANHEPVTTEAIECIKNNFYIRESGVKPRNGAQCVFIIKGTSLFYKKYNQHFIVDEVCSRRFKTYPSFSRLIGYSEQ